MPNFSTPERVLQTIRAGDPVERIRQENRVKVTDSANCVPPLTEEEARKLGIKINVNWGSLMILLAHARRQYLTAFLSNQYFFKVTLPFAPKEHQSEWQEFITQEINRPLRESLSYFELHRSRWSSVVTHGVGPMTWRDDHSWEPEYLAMSDLRIATDTTLDFKNLSWYGARHIYTPYELLKEAFGDDPNWDRKGVANILKNYKEINFTDATNNYDWETSPEKLAELVKQDGGYYGGDAMPGIPLWHFYFQDEGGWFLRIVPENGTVKGEGNLRNKFLWQMDEPVASSWQNLLHCQYGDLSTDAPFKYHSVRSLGYALLEPEFYDNLTRCRLLQHIHDNFNTWLRVTDPTDKARPQVQEFGNQSVLRAGVSVVPQTERHQIDADLVEMGMSQMRQLKQEASSTYTQQIDTGTKKEQTAFETNVKMQQVNAMLGGLLLTAFKYESYADKEICRRFCIPNSRDAAVRKFQQRCRKMGIPRRYLSVEDWEVEPMTPLGMGNPSIAQAAAKQLMEARGAYSPSAQQEILHEFTITTTGDSRKAARWAPIGKAHDVTEGEEYMQSIFGTLMQGVPIRPKEKISPIEQMDAALPMMAGKIVMMERRNNMGTPDEIAGLSNVRDYLGKLVQRIAQDPQEKQRVKQYMDAMGKLWNQVAGLAQRAQQAQQKQQGQNGQDPQAMAKVQGTMLTARVKAQTAAAKAKQDEQQSNQRFIREQRREDAKTFAEIEREQSRHQADLEHQHEKTRMMSLKE